MEKWLSRKIKFISFVLIIEVVILHANLMTDSTGKLFYVQKFVTEGITRMAVPAFFLISGFLFMYNFKGEYKKFFLQKIKSRVYSLLFPLIIWSLLGIVIVYIIQKSQIIPYQFSKETHFTFNGIINEILQPSIAFQLWFVRDLFVFVMLSPILYFILKYLKWGWIAICFAASFYIWHVGFLDLDGILFFSMGMCIALYDKNWLMIRWYHYKGLLFCIMLAFFALCGLRTYDMIPYPIWNIKNILGIISIWGLYDIGNFDFKSSKADLILSLSFFIFLFHEPLLYVIQKVIIKLSGNNGDISILIAYLLGPLLTVLISICVGIFAKLKMPKIYSILTGGR